MYAKKVEDFNIERAPFEGLLGKKGVFTLTGSAWAHSRKLVRPAFEKATISDLFKTKILSLPADDAGYREIDLIEWFQALIMDPAGHTLFGSSVGSIDSIGKSSLISKGSDIEMTYTEAFDFAQEVLAVQMALPLFMHFLVNSKRYKKACQKSKEEVMGYIERALENRVKGMKYDFLGVIVEQTQDREMIRDQVLALRVYPPVYINTRTPIRDSVLPFGGGKYGEAPFQVNKGERIVLSSFALHGNTTIYGKASREFRPERWLEDDSLRGIGWAYLPFGGGPRICPGQKMALITASFVIVRMLQQFENIAGDGRKQEEILYEVKILMTIAGGFKIKLR
ncbi:Similar to Cytochrome P450 52A4; acc. no. P16141 [Pyronema omphalodes CBS 100304]|uniref:Similar to Cytochrome P450 52A4 acc. no. P16141 n=1 Tax=Pyronema omphalodes (strain CBS 100304) TaxID=1076935 RepID=U4L7Z7_PYROM|nr:Similar to Cytochrome P450 52A4; acc. no. P16141 [Pyronema omphalodes CBS 100304]